MDNINNDTMQAVLLLIGPAGFGLLLYCMAISYAAMLLYKRVNYLTDKFIESSAAMEKAVNSLTVAVQRVG